MDYEIELSDWAMFNIGNSIRQRLTFETQSVSELTQNVCMKLVSRCIQESLDVFNLREKFYGTDI